MTIGIKIENLIQILTISFNFMMTSVSGKRGVGKTYHLAKEVYERYKQGYFIITNFSHVYANIDASALTPDEFYELLKQVLLFKDNGYEVSDLFPEFKHTGIFIAIDEGHLYFSADLYKRYQDKEDFQDIIRILAQARKLDIEIWYTTQDPSKVDKNWRRYTEDWIRFTPVLNTAYKKLIKHPTKDVFRREVRYWFPLVWEEWHDLDHTNPVFDYSTVVDAQGFSSLSKHATLQSRRLRRSGWLDPFPYKLYDSNQILAISDQKLESEYGLLKNFGVVPHFMRPDPIPWFRRHILRQTPYDERMPPRFKLKKLDLPEARGHQDGHRVFRQPTEFVDDLKRFQMRYKRAHAAGGARQALKAGAQPAADNIRTQNPASVTVEVTSE